MLLVHVYGFAFRLQERLDREQGQTSEALPVKLQGHLLAHQVDPRTHEVVILGQRVYVAIRDAFSLFVVYFHDNLTNLREAGKRGARALTVAKKPFA